MTLNTLDFQDSRSSFAAAALGGGTISDPASVEKKHEVVGKIVPTGHVSEGVHYEMKFTRDPYLIAEYRKLREKLYGIDPRFVGFRFFNQPDAENYEDPNDQMIIIYDGDKVYGGACLRISTPKRPIILNSEEDILPAPGKFYFSLRENLPKFELDKYAYAEFVRIAVDPAIRKGSAVREMFEMVLNRCLKYRVRYIFGVADKVRMRLYGQIYSSVGLKAETPNDVAITMCPEYEGVEMKLIYGDMKKFYVTPNDPDATCLLSPRTNFSFD